MMVLPGRDSHCQGCPRKLEERKKKYPPWLGPSACCLLRASPGLRTAKACRLRNLGEEPAGVSPQDPEGKGRPGARDADQEGGQRAVSDKLPSQQAHI